MAADSTAAGAAPLPEPGVPRLPIPEALERELREDAAHRATAVGEAASVCLFTLFHTDSTMCSAAVSPTGQAVAAGFEDSLVRLWSPTGSKQTGQTYGLGPTSAATLIGHSAPVYGLSFRQDGQWLLSAGGDGTARMWWLERQTAIVCFKGHAPGEPVWDVAFSPVPYYFATGCHDTTARIWVTNSTTAVRVLVGHKADVTCLGFHPNGSLLATGGADKVARLWDVCSGGCVRLFAGHSRPLSAIAVSPTGRVLATASEDGTVALWDILTSRRLRTLIGHTRPVYGLDFSSEGSVLASGGGDGTVRLWDTSERVISELLSARPNDPEPTFPNGLLNKAFITKHTPIHTLRYSRRNLLFAVGPYLPQPKPQ